MNLNKSNSIAYLFKVEYYDTLLKIVESSGVSRNSFKPNHRLLPPTLT